MISSGSMRLQRLLPIANAIACALFVLLREPATAEYLAQSDQARRSGGVIFTSPSKSSTPQEYKHECDLVEAFMKRPVK
jgi:hypothetical protein